MLEIISAVKRTSLLRQAVLYDLKPVAGVQYYKTIFVGLSVLY